jgi:hypothetical protein
MECLKTRLQGSGVHYMGLNSWVFFKQLGHSVVEQPVNLIVFPILTGVT